MAELVGHILGLKSRSSLVGFILNVQPIFTEACVMSKSLYCHGLIFLSHKIGRVIFTLKGSYENLRSYKVPDKDRYS